MPDSAGCGEGSIRALLIVTHLARARTEWTQLTSWSEWLKPGELFLSSRLGRLCSYMST